MSQFPKKTSEMIYEILNLFFKFILNIFFRSIKVRGSHNIPVEGPVLFAAAPHANQFVDPLMLFTTTNRKLGFLIAKKSWDRPLIGLFARAFNSIPVIRRQDVTKPGEGLIYYSKENPTKILGMDTKFTKFTEGAAINLPKEGGVLVIVKIVSDIEVIVKEPVSGDIAETLLTRVDEDGKPIGTKYKITPKIDQKDMYSAVVSRLSKGLAVGIFPEGGSHDQPQMLPLQAGVAIMAFETLVKFPGAKLKIVPAGIHYFNSDKFRSRAVLEYGAPIEIPIELVDQYKLGGVDKRQAIGLLMDTINVRLKELTLQASDFDSLMVAQATRRLYQSEKLDADRALVISRRFAHVSLILKKAYEVLKDHQLVQEIKMEVTRYNRMLKFYGVQDHQVKNTHINFQKALSLTIFRVLEVAFMGIICAPMIILFSPVLFFTKRVSREKAAEALAGSKVKITGKDVISTWKLITALIMVPSLWLIYSFIAFLIGYFYHGYSIGVNYGLFTLVSLPLLGIISIRLSDIAVDVMKSIRPLIVSLGNILSSSEPLREMRADLQKKIRGLVEELGPTVFPGFDEIRTLNKPKSPRTENLNYNRSAADKLGRGDIESIEMAVNENFENVDLFSKDADKEAFTSAFDKI